jgi:hypothetical protein
MVDGHPRRDTAVASSGNPEAGDLERTILADIDALTSHPDRALHGPGHAAARSYLVDRLSDAGVVPYLGADLVAPFGGGLANVLGLVPGADRHRRPLVLAAHYDTAPGSPGASDSAAAVAVVLALAARLRGSAFERGVVVALLDGAGHPRHVGEATGALALLREQRRHDLKAALVLDRLGHRNALGALLVTGVETDARLASLVDGATASAARVVPVHQRYRRDVPASAPFRTAGVPYLELWGGHWSGHGTPEDTADALDVPSLVTAATVAESLLVRLDQARLPGPYEGYDSAHFEASTLRHALASPADRAAGVGAALEGRDEVDRVIRSWDSLLGP